MTDSNHQTDNRTFLPDEDEEELLDPITHPITSPLCDPLGAPGPPDPEPETDRAPADAAPPRPDPDQVHQPIVESPSRRRLRAGSSADIHPPVPFN